MAAGYNMGMQSTDAKYLHDFVYIPVTENAQEFNDLKERMRRERFYLVDSGNRTVLVDIFQNPANRGYLALKDFQILADIEYLESQNRVQKRFWMEDETAENEEFLYESTFFGCTSICKTRYDRCFFGMWNRV